MTTSTTERPSNPDDSKITFRLAVVSGALFEENANAAQAIIPIAKTQKYNTIQYNTTRRPTKHHVVVLSSDLELDMIVGPTCLR